MRAKRTFIDWRLPALQTAVEKLCLQYDREGLVDLSDVIVVTPGARAGRRFLELLAERTDGRNLAPQLATPGDLPERLYQPQRPLADELTQHFAWMEALRGLPEQQMRAIVSDPPADGDIQAWLAFGKMLTRLHRELAADVKYFKDVAALPGIREARESDRWNALAITQDRYLRTLDDLELWDRQTARLVAIEKSEPATDCDIYLIGVADMNGTLRAMLRPVAERVHVLVHAPETLAERFDDFGILEAATWEQAPIELDEKALGFADRPIDQADRVVEFIGERANDGLTADDVVIGLADESLASPVRIALEERGVKSRWIGGRTAGATSIAQLLAAIADRLDSDATSNTCKLVRHPDVSGWLDRQGLPAGWLAMIDRAVIDHAPRRLGGGQGVDGPLATSREVAHLIERLLSPLKGANRPLGDWAAPVCQVLEALVGDQVFGDDEAGQRERQAAELLRDALHGQSQIPESLVPLAAASVTIRLALESVAGQLLTPESMPDAVEMIGWLELPLDDAPDLVVCGFNEGFVPSSLNSDLFLPNSLREQMGLEDNCRRYARDAYALSVLIHSRRAVRFVSGRHNALGDPLQPSRLIFATDPRTIARRVLKAFGPSQSAIPAELGGRQTSGFRVPREREGIEVTKLRVTAFRDYIACPYRFYLRHIEHLESVGDPEGELTAANFGTLIHEALRRWADSDLRDADDPAQVRRFVEDAFDAAADRLFDEDPLPAARLQLEQAKSRLTAFALWQAEHRRQGWRVRHHEVRVSRELTLENGRKLTISGQIDRIDYHPDRDAWLILDYKTADSGDGPEKVHLQGGEWVDLQLPLYRFLAASLDIPGEPAVAYVAMGKDRPKAPNELLKEARWSTEQWAEADRLIRRIAHEVAAGKFWPPTSNTLRFDDFACIVQEGVFGREAWEC